jgi:hypothetical protein
VAAYLENRKKIGEKIVLATTKALGAVDEPDERGEFVDFEGIGEDAIAGLPDSAEMSGRGPAPPTVQPGKSGKVELTPTEQREQQQRKDAFPKPPPRASSN